MPVNCEDMAANAKSSARLRRAKTMEEFLRLWARFYEGKQCVPTYLGNYLPPKDKPWATDNPYATRESAGMFAELTRLGVVATNSQVNLDDGVVKQREYIDFLAPKSYVRSIVREVNFEAHLNAIEVGETRLSIPLTFVHGKPSLYGGRELDPRDIIPEHLGAADDYTSMLVWCSDPSQPMHYALGVLLDTVRHKAKKDRGQRKKA